MFAIRYENYIISSTNEYISAVFEENAKGSLFLCLQKRNAVDVCLSLFADIYKSDTADDHASTSSSEMAQLEDVCLSQGMNTI